MTKKVVHMQLCLDLCLQCYPQWYECQCSHEFLCNISSLLAGTKQFYLINPSPLQDRSFLDSYKQPLHKPIKTKYNGNDNVKIRERTKTNIW